MARPPGLDVAGLGLDRGGRAILQDLSFHVAPGTALAVTGPNGAGKSTLLRAIAGFLPATTGTIAWRDPADPEARVAECAHYLGHADGLKAALTAQANLLFFATWLGGGGLAPSEALAVVGLGALADFPLAVFSAGQRRRVALARLLVARRAVWLLDEPATALDAASEAVLARLMRDHLGGGGLIMAALHATLDVPARTLRLGA